MSFKPDGDDDQEYFSDILDAVAKLEEVMEGKSFADYEADWKLRLLTERLLGIITEAVIRLDHGDNRLRFPAIPWDQARGMGNAIRHNYDSLTKEIIWKTVHEDLPKLKAVAHAAIAE